jgi:TRAP-type C4-dicarboxylate transport system permease small subunit
VTALSEVFGRLFDVLASLASAILLAMVAVVTADILLRDFFGSGIAWSNEVSEYALYVITVLTAPWLLRRGQHVRIDIVLTMVPPQIAWLMEAFGDLFGFAVCVVLVRYGFGMSVDSWQTGSTTIKNLIFPEWWLLSLLPACFLLLAIEFVFRFHRLLAGERTRRSDATSVS